VGAATPDAFALLGPLSLDVYLGRDLVLPGGGALNMAWWWRRTGEPFELFSRVGDDRPGCSRRSSAATGSRSRASS
jgi:sugar/nucleoside kinase (ribokinase family)